MLGIHDFGVFLAAALLLNLTPGQDTLFILGRSLAEGRGAGVASALGIGAGSLVHTLAAALGLSAVLATSEAAFLLVELLGAAYLVYLGLRLLLDRGAAAAIDTAPRSSGHAALFRQGLLTNLGNPKVALFFLAFLPQFVDPHSPTRLAALLVLGGTFVFTGTAWCLVLALAAARLRAGLAGRSAWRSGLSPAAGLLFVALGLRLVASRA